MSDLQIYLREKISFSIPINFIEGSKKNYFVFKPYINIQSKEKRYLEIIVKELKLMNTQIISVKKVTSKTMYKIAIQNFDDIENALKELSNYLFFEKSKEQAYLRFKEVFAMIKMLPKTNVEYDERFDEILEKRLLINVNRRAVEKPEITIKKIKTFLEKNNI